MYVCGITPYDATHLGHAATYLLFDELQRVCRDAGKTVRYVQNVTDVDDPLLERAVQTGQDWTAIAERETQLFREDMAALRIIAPDGLHRRGRGDPGHRGVDRGAARPGRGLRPRRRHLLLGRCRARLRRGQPPRRRRDGAAVGGARRGPASAGQEGPARLPALAGRAAGGAGVGLRARARPAGLAHRVRRDRAEAPRSGHRRPGRRRRPGLPAPRAERRRGRGDHRLASVRAAYLHQAMVGYHGEKMSKSKGNLVLVSMLRESGVDPMAIRLALLAHSHHEAWEWQDGEIDAAIERLGRWRAGLRGRRAIGGRAVAAAARFAAQRSRHPRCVERRRRLGGVRG